MIPVIFSAGLRACDNDLLPEPEDRNGRHGRSLDEIVQTFPPLQLGAGGVGSPTVQTAVQQAAWRAWIVEVDKVRFGALTLSVFTWLNTGLRLRRGPELDGALEREPVSSVAVLRLLQQVVVVRTERTEDEAGITGAGSWAFPDLDYHTFKRRCTDCTRRLRVVQTTC